MKKYELTSMTCEEIASNGDTITLYGIIALRDIPEHDIGAGSLGGYIEKESNLSQDGTAWIEQGAKVYDEAVIKDSSLIKGSAIVSGNAVIKGSSMVTDALISEDSLIQSTTVQGEIIIQGHSVLYRSELNGSDYVISGGSYIQNSNLNLKRSQIKGNTKIEQSLMIGTDYLLDGNVHLVDTRIGIYVNKHHALSILGNARISHCGLFPKGNMLIKGDVYLEYCSLTGSNIEVSVKAVIEGMDALTVVYIASDSTFTEYVNVKNFTGDKYRFPENTMLNGDTHLELR